MTTMWSYLNDTAAPVKVRIGQRAYVLQPGQTIDVPEGVMAMSSQMGRLTRLEHQAPRARYFAADRCGVMRPTDAPAAVRVGDDIEADVELDDTPAFDAPESAGYDGADDDTSEDA